MSDNFRPLTPEEMADCEAEIKKAEDEIKVREEYIAYLKERIQKGCYTSSGQNFFKTVEQTVD